MLGNETLSKLSKRARALLTGIMFYGVLKASTGAKRNLQRNFEKFEREDEEKRSRKKQIVASWNKPYLDSNSQHFSHSREPRVAFQELTKF